MIAIRLPTGEFDGRHASESGRTTRIRSGSICKTSPITVETRVSWPCPDEVLWMVTVTKPSPSILMRQESIQVVVVFFSLSKGSNEELPPLGSRQAAMPMPASMPEARSRSRSFSILAKSICANTLSTTV